MRVGVEAILVSPNFLFRIERDPNPTILPPSIRSTITNWPRGSPISYGAACRTRICFELAGEASACSHPDVLHAQVRRMLADPKSEALVDNFAGQWLELRNLDSIRPDPGRVPAVQ